MLDVSLNLELIYKDMSPEIGARAAFAAEDGVRFVELWTTTDKDPAALRRAFDAAGVKLVSMLSEPRAALSHAPDLTAFYDGIKASAERASILGCPHIVASSGPATPAQKRAVQHARVVEVLQKAGELLNGSGVTLLLENINTRVDHPGALLDLAMDCAEVLETAKAPNVGMLVDLYHAATMREDLEAVITRTRPFMRHVQVAGVPGRAEPLAGPGNIWPKAIAALKAAGYSGPVGLEYFPVLPSRESVKAVLAAVNEAA